MALKKSVTFKSSPFSESITGDSGKFAGTDTYIGSVLAYSLDVHIECDTDGSRNEYSK